MAADDQPGGDPEQGIALRDLLRSRCRSYWDRVRDIDWLPRLALHVCFLAAASADEKGREKENFHVRLTDALEAVRRHQQRCLRSETSAIDDETESLRRFQSELSATDRRNPGMSSI